jgi:dynamin 1-like protein
LIGGARISYIFHEIFNNVINNIDPFSYLTDQDIQTAIGNAKALHPGLYVPEGAFEVLIRQQIARLLEPSLDCVHEVYQELRRLILSVEHPALKTYPKLQCRICDTMEHVLDQCLTPCNDMVINLFEVENAYINTQHPEFIGNDEAMLNLFNDGDEEEEDDDYHNSK